MTKVSLVIPYFQRKTGILRRALDSVLKQKLPINAELEIIIVDDGSPISAKSEIEGMNFSAPFHLKLIEQANGGVAVARNKGLDNVAGDTTFVAFLDSDDIWEETHLETALTALSDNYDYYFTDHCRLGQHAAAFKEWGFKPTILPHAAGGSLHAADKDEIIEAILRFAISHMSSVVFRWQCASTERFNPALSLAGEDVIYLIKVALKCNQFCYSSDIKVTCADGVNIWSSRYDWDAPTHMASQLCRLISMQEIHDQLPLTKKTLSFASSVITQLRRYFAFMSIREFIRKRRFWPANVDKMRRYDPSFWKWYPLNLIYVFIFYPLRIYIPKD